MFGLRRRFFLCMYYNNVPIAFTDLADYIDLVHQMSATEHGHIISPLQYFDLVKLVQFIMHRFRILFGGDGQSALSQYITVL